MSNLIDPIIVTGFAMEEQEQTLWCWAAAANSVWKLYRPNAKNQFQCTVANKTLTDVDRCCMNPFPCNKSSKISDALTAVHRLKEARSGVINWDDIKVEVSKDKVICAAIKWRDTGFAHCIAIMGVGTDQNGTEMVVVDDPGYDQDQQIVAFDELVNNYQGKGNWVFSFLTKK